MERVEIILIPLPTTQHFYYIYPTKIEYTKLDII